MMWIFTYKSDNINPSNKNIKIKELKELTSVQGLKKSLIKGDDLPRHRKSTIIHNRVSLLDVPQLPHKRRKPSIRSVFLSILLVKKKESESKF